MRFNLTSSYPFATVFGVATGRKDHGTFDSVSAVSAYMIANPPIEGAAYNFPTLVDTCSNCGGDLVNTGANIEECSDCGQSIATVVPGYHVWSSGENGWAIKIRGVVTTEFETRDEAQAAIDAYLQRRAERLALGN